MQCVDEWQLAQGQQMQAGVGELVLTTVVPEHE
jgi:hypothetical protein